MARLETETERQRDTRYNRDCFNRQGWQPQWPPLVINRTTDFNKNFFLFQDTLSARESRRRMRQEPLPSPSTDTTSSTTQFNHLSNESPVLEQDLSSSNSLDNNQQQQDVTTRCSRECSRIFQKSVLRTLLLEIKRGLGNTRVPQQSIITMIM